MPEEHKKSVAKTGEKNNTKDASKKTEAEKDVKKDSKSEEKEPEQIKIKKIELPSLDELLQAGVHFGHRISRWYPKMKPYIFGVRNGVHVIDLEQTHKQLAVAAEYVSHIVAKGGTILFVGTKKQAKAIVKQAAESCDMPYVDERWLGGTFTNFKQISQLAKRYHELQDMKNGADWDKYTKKEQSVFNDEIVYLEKKVKGLLNMHKKPDAVFIVGIKEEETAVKEAISMRIPIVGVCDTNVDPTPVSVIIPGNDDAVRGIELIANTIAKAISANKR